MTNRLPSNWDFARVLRLVFAAVFLVAAIMDHEPLAYAAAAFLGVQAVFNIGCCGLACAPRSTQATKDEPHTEINYEEVR